MRIPHDSTSTIGYIEAKIPAIVIAVHKDYRRQGIGEKMMGWLLDQASAHNIHQISLMVSKDNYAIKLYRKSGFWEYADKGDAWLMLRQI